MGQIEIKPSFSLKYIILLLIGAIITSVVGVSIGKYFEAKPERVITVYETEIESLINNEIFSSEKVKADYYLEDQFGNKQIINSLFKVQRFVKNEGNNGVENLILSISVADSVNLIERPKIRTQPSEIIKAITVTKLVDQSTNQKHVWSISLLNPGESIIFDYSIYSKEEVDKIDFTFLPRKKDWNVNFEPLLASSNDKYTLITIILIVLGSPIIFLLALLIIAVPFYLAAWSFKPHFRKVYSNFIEFYMRHSPTNIFESKSETYKRIIDSIEPIQDENR